jgi:hypothetical protein
LQAVQSLSAVDEFERIILYRTAQQLVPFLLNLATENVVAVRETLKKLWRDLDRRDASNNWQAAITTEQEDMLQLAAIVTFTPAQVLRPPMRFWFAHRCEPRPEFWQIITHARPVWLADLLLPAARSTDTWGVPYYSFLRKLEQRQLLQFEPELFAKTLYNWLPELGDSLSNGASIPLDANAAVVQLLTENELVLTRDLLLVFEFDTHIEKARCRVQKRPAVTEDWNGRWQEWNQLHPPQGMNWQEVFVRLTASGHLDRADILTRCLLALRRDFRRPLLTWFRELFLALKPTFTERLARQAELTELLAHPQALVVNFALDQLKDMHTEPGFNLAPLLLSAESLLTRPDLKVGLRSLVAGLARLPYRALAPAPAVASLLTTALAQPDATVQNHAAQGLAGLLSAPKLLLTTAETAAVLAALAPQASYLGPAARAALASWLAAPAEATATPARYAPLVDFVPDISPATAIAPVADWHDLLFLTGQVLQHDDPAARERWLDGLLRLQGQLPADYAMQLQPYLRQALPQLKKAGAEEARALLAEPPARPGHDGLLLALLLGWVEGFATPRVAAVEAAPHARTPPLPAAEQQRYLFLETQLRTGVALPLLSTPTHQPHWVAPSVLVNRLLAYQAAGTAPCAADLAVALARAAHAHPAEAAQAQHLLPQLADAGLRELLTWFFGPAGQPLPALAPANGHRPAQLAASVAEALPELWAVAARTKAPAATFPTLAASLGYDYPGTAHPLATTCEAVPHENRYPDPTQPGQEAVYRFVELSWHSGPKEPAPSPLLLYAPPAGQRQRGSWENAWQLASELPHLLALLPNYPAPLYAHVLRQATWADNLEVSERDLLLQALHSLLGPGPALAVEATAVLASGLIHHTPQGRSLAQEVLLQAIAHGRLLPATLGHVLGLQLASGYAPAPRLADALRPLTALDGPTDDALGQMLHALLPGLPATPPRNLRPLLDTYASLLAHTRRALPAALRPNLLAWQKTVSLRAVVTPLLALPQ